MTLSLYLIVGIGDKLVHQPLNGNTLPQSHHLINQKRAEAMLIPASVMKDQLIVYSISGSVGRLLKEVSKELIQTSGMKTILDKSYDQHAKLNIIEQASIQAAFAVTAPIIEITSISHRRDLSLLAPSGVEYDVSPIVEEIISKLDSQLIRLVQPRAVCAWHPLFTVVVSVMPAKHKHPKYHAIVMSARRKSSIATSYHNVGDSLRSIDFSDNVRAHYGLLREEKGFLSGLLTYLSVFAR